jgi:act minimal PKS acyl carrier protein
VPTLPIDEFKSILREVAGDDDSIDLSGDILDVSLADLGYDSLAVLEVGAVVRRRYGVTVPDDSTERMTTVRNSLEYLNGLLIGVSA